ncbi:uncharacterized protein LOC118675777 isoform X3 [Myotis myotis]|uniref:uncharacterized protein LOC118675777 isoform X3 n=1 Tax=Myotis myotis TaxID=51298 RepID=UPI00174A23E1|nr:uncharacterized protein LOC118675777 isoform X3 [Myotis myotis]
MVSYTRREEQKTVLARGNSARKVNDDRGTAWGFNPFSRLDFSETTAQGRFPHLLLRLWGRRKRDGVFPWTAGTCPASDPEPSGPAGQEKTFPLLSCRGCRSRANSAGGRAPGARTSAKGAVATQRGRGLPRAPVVPAHSPASAFVP